MQCYSALNRTNSTHRTDRISDGLCNVDSLLNRTNSTRGTDRISDWACGVVSLFNRRNFHALDWSDLGWALQRCFRLQFKAISTHRIDQISDGLLRCYFRLQPKKFPRIGLIVSRMVFTALIPSSIQRNFHTSDRSDLGWAFAVLFPSSIEYSNTPDRSDPHFQHLSMQIFRGTCTYFEVHIFLVCVSCKVY